MNVLYGAAGLRYISRPMTRLTIKKTRKTKPDGALGSCARQ